MNIEKRDFDKEAASWDEKPLRLKLAKEIADAISKQVPLTPDMIVIDFGCGTGLLTIELHRLQPLVNSITGIDSSQGMLDILNMKISRLNLTNVSTLLVDIDKGDTLQDNCCHNNYNQVKNNANYNLITSSMTLHHIKEVMPLLKQFHDIIKIGGYLCIADLDLENGTFHDDKTGVFHSGFDRTALRQAFIDTGFKNVKDVSAAEVVKPGADGKTKGFTVFLMTGQKI